MKQLGISNIRLGWVQRFRSVARHQNIVKAGQECNVDPTSLSDSIQNLEDAICKLLMAPATARPTAAGRAFVPLADEILGLSSLSQRSIVNVSVSWFQALSAVSETENYAEASKILGWNRYKVMRGVSELQSWVGRPLVFVGNGIKLTVEGRDILAISCDLIVKLEEFRGSPEHWKVGKNIPRKKPWWLRTWGAHAPSKDRKRREARVDLIPNAASGELDGTNE